MSLLQTAQRADEQISAIKAAFGAPGDYGYESREGLALYDLYKFQVELRGEIAKATEETTTERNATVAEPLRSIVNSFSAGVE